MNKDEVKKVENREETIIEELEAKGYSPEMIKAELQRTPEEVKEEQEKEFAEAFTRDDEEIVEKMKGMTPEEQEEYMTELANTAEENGEDVEGSNRGIVGDAGVLGRQLDLLEGVKEFKEIVLPTTLTVDRQYKVSGEIEDEDSEESVVDIHLFQTEPATVRYGLSKTTNLGNFESFKVSVEIEVPCYKEEIEQAKKYAYKTCEEELFKKINEVQALI